MGRFFSNIQIHNKGQEKREQFTKSFCRGMEKKGYSVGAEDDSELSYILAFSENNNWVTLCKDDYESGGESVKKDVQFLAESLKTCCISTSVVDSDFAILEMYNGTSTLTDMVVVGDGSGYGFEDDTKSQGKQEHWEPYLKNESTWAQLSDIWKKNFTFTEEALAKMAPLLDMNPQNIISDFDDLSSITDKNIVALHFKNKGKKALSLNAAFKQVFGEALEPLGFAKLKKAKHPYFIRVINGEILHVISYCREQSGLTGYSSFNIIGGVVTVYNYNLDFAKGQLEGLLELYRFSNSKWSTKDIISFNYKSDDNESLLSKLRFALDITKETLPPFIGDVVDVDSFIEYSYKVYPSSMHLNNVEKIIKGDYPSNGLLLIKTDKYATHIENYLKRSQAIYEQNVKLKKNGYTQEELERRCQRYEEVNKREISLIEEIFKNPELCAKAFAELEHRKEVNTEILRSYGLEIS